MNVELNSETACWVEAEVSSGHFRTAKEVLDHAVALAQLGALRTEVETADLGAGEFTGEEIPRDVERHLSEMFLKHREGCRGSSTMPRPVGN